MDGMVSARFCCMKLVGVEVSEKGAQRTELQFYRLVGVPQQCIDVAGDLFAGNISHYA